ncbi:putative nucleotidyltransferase, ribonuclease H [Tanacetum coccineum]
MVQHQYKTPNDEKDSLLEETISSFIKESHWMKKKSENFVWRIKRNYDRTFKNQASTIKTIEKNLGRIAELIHGRRIGTLPSFTEMNPRGLAHAITTRSGLNYQPPKNHLEDSNNLQNATTECDFKPTRMCIELANKTTKFPKGIAENVVVKIDKFVFPVDFVILDMEEDHRTPIILGRPFLATTHAMIDVFNKKISFEVGDEIITFDLEKSMRFPPSDEDTCHFADIIDLSVVDNIKEILPQNHDNSIESILDHLPAVHEDCNNPAFFAANSINEEKPTPKLKELPSHLEYVFLDDNRELPVIISSLLSNQEKRLNPKVQDVIKTKILKLLDARLIYAILDSPWVSPIHVVPKKGGTTVTTNKDNKLIPTRTVTGWRVCIDYRKLNDATRKDHFPLPFIDQMLERLSGNEYYCFLNGFSGYFQIPLVPEDQEKTTFTCPYVTFAHRRMPFGLCNAPATFQRCMAAIFHDMCKDFMEVFMDDFFVFRNSFGTCLNNLSKMLARCKETNLVLNWEKCHFMVKEGIVFGHKISKAGIEVDKAKVDVIVSLPYPTNIKGILSFLRHAGFYRRFIKDFSKIARPMTQLLMKEAKFDFSDECIKSFDILRDKLITAPVIITPNWDLDFELMCDANDYVVGAVLGQHIEKKFRPIYYASKTMNNAQEHYTTTKKNSLKYLFSKQDAKPKLIRWVLLLQEFTIEIKDKKGTKNLATDHLSRLENPGLEELNEDTIQDNFPDEHLMVIKLKDTETDPKEWADKLDDALWAFRTTYKIPIGSTPFRIVYEKACHLPIELEHKAYWALKNINLDLDVAGKHRFLQLNQLDEFWTEAYEHSRASKERTKRWHDSKIMDKEFQEGEENPKARRQLWRPARLIIMW